MKAVLKRIHSPDVIDLVGFIPKDPSNFSLLLQLIVSPEDDQGEESFDVLLCTPLSLIAKHQVSDIIIGRHYLIVFEYNYPKIYKWLRDLVDQTEGQNWEEIGLRLGRIGKWEFEDYQV